MVDPGSDPWRQHPTGPGRRASLWREVRVVPETGSTNADLLAAAERGEAEGLVLVAERQTAGRGRLDRRWEAPAGTGLTFSALLRPAVPAASLGWLSLLTGLAVAEAVREVGGVAARVKWPNDVLVGDRKLAGVLAEARLPGVVVGVGLNAGLAAADLPVPTATSLLVEGSWTADRAEVLDAILGTLAARYADWVDAAGDAEACGLRAAYTVQCATVGRRVRAELAVGATLEGEALGVDAHGRLRVAEAASGQVHELAVGDIVHLR